jgi:hypothetical protein
LLLHLLEVHPRAEGLAFTANDHHAHAGVIVEAIEEGSESGENGSVEGVATVRPVQPDRRHPIFNDSQDLVGHAEG